MRYVDTSYIQPISKKDAQKEKRKNYEEGMLNEHPQIHLTLNNHRYLSSLLVPRWGYGERRSIFRRSIFRSEFARGAGDLKGLAVLVGGWRED
jgi:hypothetical protein